MKYSLPGKMQKRAEFTCPIPPRTRVESADTHRGTVGRIVSACPELFKIRIALFAALSAATGTIAAGSAVSRETLISAGGVFLLACGAGTLNQLQERKSDALMQRTRSRPIPSGRVMPGEALFTAVILIAAGLVTLSLAGSFIVSGLGMFAVFWYNLVYTNLKRVTAFAAVPGALTGAVPPAVGWITAGGSASDMRLLALCFFFFIWQVPHFWLLLLSHAEDFKNAEIPSLSKVFGHDQLIRLTALWMSAAAVSSLFIPLYGIPVPIVVHVALLSAASWLIWNGLSLFRHGQKQRAAFAHAFRNINIYMVVVMLLMNAGSLF